ncbi:MAG: glycoside hydrolase family 2, partial [Tannerella sp.]|nr:glycoside hydrolase family 2 [Tannerella sp.]
AEQAVAWTSYLARSCYMLQQGEYVADIAYYYGEDNNITVMFSGRNGNGLPEIPEGYSYDFVNADALVNLMSVENGRIVTPSGMSYRLLVLDPNSRYMTLSVLRKIRDMVKNGAVVTGTKPVQTPSLADDPAEFDAIVSELWANETGANSAGKGKIYAGTSLPDVLKTEGVAQDFGAQEGSVKLFFVHRKVDDIQIYWVANHDDRADDIEATFRVDGMEPEIWHPETGLIEKASYRIENGVTKVKLHLEPVDAIFVVFRNRTNVKSFTLPEISETRLAAVDGEWNVSFQAGRGAPEKAVFTSLTPWNEKADRGIKYFSGTGSYSKTLHAPAEWFTSGAQLWLDLGDAQNLAEVAVNGKSLGIVWKKPFKVNVTDALKQGDNNLEIKVTNLWVNRLIGDRQPDEKNPVTFTTSRPYTADTPLKPSGLLGPVAIIKKTTK